MDICWHWASEHVSDCPNIGIGFRGQHVSEIVNVSERPQPCLGRDIAGKELNAVGEPVSLCLC
jgi:hypothetical protein